MSKIKVGFIGVGLMGLPMEQNIAKNTKGDIASIENFILEDCSGIMTWLTYFLILIRLIILNPTSIMHTIKGILLDVPSTPTINGPSAKRYGGSLKLTF